MFFIFFSVIPPLQYFKQIHPQRSATKPLKFKCRQIFIKPEFRRCLRFYHSALVRQVESFSSEQGTSWWGPAPKQYHNTADHSVSIHYHASGKITLQWLHVLVSDMTLWSFTVLEFTVIVCYSNQSFCKTSNSYIDA